MILIPENENRLFKYGILPNKLKYTIIYDKNADTSNVVMNVRIGSLYEPLEFMGLAHFLEHMLFMGSNKYTDEDYYFSKLKEYGGSANAYTADYQTVYYFNVISHNLDKIIDIFSRFFIDPLFNINSVSREINAVNSEHLKNYNNDTWILRQLILNLTEKNHIVNRFSTGSHETLGSDINKVRDAMIKLYNTYYCANNMCLVVQSNKPIKDVESIIKKCFSSVREKKTSHPIVPIKKFKSFNNEYVLQTVKDNDTIVYFWECHDFYYYKDDKVINIIINAIKLNCHNNLQNKLIEAKLINGNIEISYVEIGILILAVNINNKKSIPLINDMIRSYFNNLKSNSSNINWEAILDYNYKSYELNYHNRIKEDNMDLASNIANNMHYYDESNIYNGGKLIIKKDYNKIYKTLELLTFDKVNIIYGTKKKLCSNGKDKLIKEKYYGKNYCSLSTSLIPKNNNNYNNYNYNINIDKDILNIKPMVIKNLDKYNKIHKVASRFWYGAVSKFNEPIVVGQVIIYNNSFFNNIISLLTSIIAISVINYYMQLVFCNEIDIGYSTSFSFNNKNGIITLNIIGFNDKYIDFFNKVIDNISKIEPSKAIIENDIALYKKELKNMDKNSPWDMSADIIYTMINKYVYDYKDELKEINNITIDMVKQRINKIINIKKLPVVTFIYGNINLYSNKEFEKFYTYKLNLNLKIDKPPKQSLPKKLTLKHPNKDEKNSCISFVFPIMNNNNELLTAKLFILSTIMERPAFDELRTKAQLGYLVSCKLKTDKISYIKLSVQSIIDNKKVEELMNTFINEHFMNLLKTLDIKTFNLIKKSIYDSMMEKKNNLLEMANSYNSEIVVQEYIFDRQARVAKKLKEITLNDIIKLYHSIIKNKIVINII